MDKDVLEAMLTEGLSLEAIGRATGKHPSTVSYWLKKHGLAAVNRDRNKPRGRIPREVLEKHVAEGLSVREIAECLDRAPVTVRHWLKRHGLETRLTAHRRRTTEAANGDRFVAQCRVHGETEFVFRSDSGSSCLRCRSEAVSDRRRRLKRELVAEAGGACALCGYDACLAALQFHHIDPATKRFSVGTLGYGASAREVRAEAAKCVLLCANCHAEVEFGARTAPS